MNDVITSDLQDNNKLWSCTTLEIRAISGFDKHLYVYLVLNNVSDNI